MALHGKDETGSEHSILLVQHGVPNAVTWSAHIPGRLYFDDVLVPMRSELEHQILALLKRAKVPLTDTRPTQDAGPAVSVRDLAVGDDTHKSISSIIDFVESEAHLQFAGRVKLAGDTTRYTVWAAYDEHSLSRVVVRIARMLGIGIPAARGMLKDGVPLAEGLSALEVVERRERYASEGVPLRIEPPFRWRTGNLNPGSISTTEDFDAPYLMNSGSVMQPREDPQ